MRVVACGERVDEEEDLDDDGDEPEDEALAVEDVHGHVDAEEEERDAGHVAGHAHDHRQVVDQVQHPDGVLLRIRQGCNCHPELHVVVLGLGGGPSDQPQQPAALVGVVLLVDEGEVVEAGERHDHAVHDGVEVADVDGLDGAEVGAAAQAEELEDLALEVGLRVKEERGAHGEEEADGNLDDADEGGVEDLEGPYVLEVGEEEEEEENAHGEVGRDDAGQDARQEEDRADALVGTRGRGHVQVLGVAAGLLLQVA